MDGTTGKDTRYKSLNKSRITVKVVTINNIDYLVETLLHRFPLSF